MEYAEYENIKIIFYWLDNFEWLKVNSKVGELISSDKSEFVFLIFERAHMFLLKSNSELMKITNENLQKAGLTDVDSDIINFHINEIKEDAKKLIQNIVSLICAANLQVTNNVYGKIYEEAFNSKSNECRLCVAGTVINPEYFLNDEDSRVIKVANIRIEFANKLANYSAEERELIHYLVNYLQTGKILPILVVERGHEYNANCGIKFRSEMFDNYQIVPEFDRDILNPITDKNVLADYILGLLKSGVYHFKPEYEPECLKTILSGQGRK